MGDFTIQISSKLINQLNKDTDQSKKKPKKIKPKVSPQRKTDQPKTHQDTYKPNPMAELPTQPSLFFPIQHQTSANTELESIKSVLKESEKVLEKLEKQEKYIVHKVTERAKDLREKEFKIPEPKSMPCSAENEAWMQCYKENIDNPLKCSGLVKSFQDCARLFRQQLNSEGK